MKRFLCVLACLLPAICAHAGWRGYVAAELLGFIEDPRDSRQHDAYVSLAFEPEYFHEWNQRDDLFTFKPYFMLDAHDNNRTSHFFEELGHLSFSKVKENVLDYIAELL